MLLIVNVGCFWIFFLFSVIFSCILQILYENCATGEFSQTVRFVFCLEKLKVVWDDSFLTSTPMLKWYWSKTLNWNCFIVRFFPPVLFDCIIALFCCLFSPRFMRSVVNRKRMYRVDTWFFFFGAVFVFRDLQDSCGTLENYSYGSVFFLVVKEKIDEWKGMKSHEMCREKTYDE